MRSNVAERFGRTWILALPGLTHEWNSTKAKRTNPLYPFDFQNHKLAGNRFIGSAEAVRKASASRGCARRVAFVGILLTLAFAAISVPAGFAQGYTLAEALNATDLVWTADSTDDTAWIVQTAITHDGVAAAKCVPHVGTCGAKLHTTLSGPGSLTFWFRFGSGPPLGTWLEVVLQDQGAAPRRILYGGSTEWSQGGMTIGRGICQLQWGVDVRSTPEAVFLDQIQFTPSARATIEGLTILQGKARVNFSAPAQLASSFRLLNSAHPSGPWTTNTAAVLSTNAPGASFTFTAPLDDSSAQFYLVQTATGP